MPIDGYLMTIIAILNSALSNLTEICLEEPKFYEIGLYRNRISLTIQFVLETFSPISPKNRQVEINCILFKNCKSNGYFL